MSIVKIVDEELKMEVREDIRAANITASIMPRAPEKYDIHVFLLYVKQLIQNPKEDLSA